MAKIRITNGVLLQHIQGMKYELIKRLDNTDKDVRSLKTSLGSIKTEVTQLRKEMTFGFEDARLHREALQEDSDATIKMLGKHDRRLRRLQRA